MITVGTRVLRSRGLAQRKLQTVGMGSLMSTGVAKKLKRARQRGERAGAGAASSAPKTSAEQLAERTKGWLSGYKLTAFDGKSFFPLNDRKKIQYAEGAFYKVGGDVKLCHNGLHYSNDPLHALYILGMKPSAVALWKIKANPKGRVQKIKEGIEKSAVSEMFVERMCEDAEQKEKLTGWIHMYPGQGSSTAMVHMYHLNGSHIANVDEKDGQLMTTTLVGTCDGLYFESFSPCGKSRQGCVEALKRACDKVEEWGRRILAERVSKQRPHAFVFDADDMTWQFKPFTEGDVFLEYRTPFDERDTSNVFVRAGGATGVRGCESLEAATAMVDVWASSVLHEAKSQIR